MTLPASAQTWVAAALLAATGGLMLARGNKDHVPPSLPLSTLPLTLGAWQGQDQVIPDNVLEVLGKGEFLNRVYQRPAAAGGTAIPVGFFIGYFPTQRSGQSIHSPQNCLPGAGWSFDHSGTTEFEAGGKPYTVGEYVIANGSNRAEVLYWYRTQGQNIANDYSAKAHMLLNSILHDRTDAALIRIMTPILPGETQAAAHARALTFAKTAVPGLSAYIPD